MSQGGFRNSSYRPCTTCGRRTFKSRILCGPCQRTKSLSARKQRKLISRFWSKVARVGIDECWLWQAFRNPVSGYGGFSFEGKNEGAHRVAWILTYGPIPEGKQINHTCDIKPCCNPNHLYLGTQVDNIKDRVVRGRGRLPVGTEKGRFSTP